MIQANPTRDSRSATPPPHADRQAKKADVQNRGVSAADQTHNHEKNFQVTLPENAYSHLVCGLAQERITSPVPALVQRLMDISHNIRGGSSGIQQASSNHADLTKIREQGNATADQIEVIAQAMKTHHQRGNAAIMRVIAFDQQERAQLSLDQRAVTTGLAVAAHEIGLLGEGDTTLIERVVAQTVRDMRDKYQHKLLDFDQALMAYLSGTTTLEQVNLGPDYCFANATAHYPQGALTRIFSLLMPAGGELKGFGGLRMRSKALRHAGSAQAQRNICAEMAETLSEMRGRVTRLTRLVEAQIKNGSSPYLRLPDQAADLINPIVLGLEKIEKTWLTLLNDTVMPSNIRTLLNDTWRDDMGLSLARLKHVAQADMTRDDLWRAVADDDVDKMRLLLAADPTRAVILNGDGSSLLHAVRSAEAFAVLYPHCGADADRKNTSVLAFPLNLAIARLDSPALISAMLSKNSQFAPGGAPKLLDYYLHFQLKGEDSPVSLDQHNATITLGDAAFGVSPAGVPFAQCKAVSQVDAEEHNIVVIAHALESLGGLSEAALKLLQEICHGKFMGKNLRAFAQAVRKYYQTVSPVCEKPQQRRAVIALLKTLLTSEVNEFLSQHGQAGKTLLSAMLDDMLRRDEALSSEKLPLPHPFGASEIRLLGAVVASGHELLTTLIIDQGVEVEAPVFKKDSARQWMRALDIALLNKDYELVKILAKATSSGSTSSATSSRRAISTGAALREHQLQLLCDDNCDEKVIEVMHTLGSAEGTFTKQACLSIWQELRRDSPFRTQIKNILSSKVANKTGDRGYRYLHSIVTQQNQNIAGSPQGDVQFYHLVLSKLKAQLPQGAGRSQQPLDAYFGKRENTDAQQAGESNKKTRNAIYYAARSGNVAALKVLIDLGCNLTLPVLSDSQGAASSDDERGFMPLHVAIKYGSIDAIKHLIQAYPKRALEHAKIDAPVSFWQKLFGISYDRCDAFDVLKKCAHADAVQQIIKDILSRKK